MLISFQVAGIIIIFIIVSFFLAQTRLTLKSAKLFLLVCTSTVILLSLDIFSVYLITRVDLNLTLREIFAKIYLIFLIIESTFGIVYLLRDIYKFDKKKRRIFYLAHLIYILVGGTLIMLTDISLVYEKENHVLYTEGASCLCCYALSGVALITTIVTVVIYKDKLNKANRDTMIIWMSFWIIAAVTQFFFKSLLVVSFASACGLIIIYINLENPALTIDKKTAKFNFELLEECVTELTDKNIDYKIVYIVMNGTSNDANLKNDALMSYSNSLSHFTNTKISMKRNKFLTFRSDLGFVNIIQNTTSKDFFNHLEKELSDSNYKKHFDDAYNIKFLIIENSKIVSGYEQLKSLFASILEKNLISLNLTKNYIDSSTIEEINKIKEMEKTLNYALDNDLVEVYYQPIYSKSLNKFTSAEALVRIKDKDGKIIYPGAFIEIAERNGSISKLGEMVFTHVCSFLKETNIKSLGLKYIEVNLSVVQCGDPNLASKYIEIMNKYNIEPKEINLEITETASSNLRNIMLHNMNKLIDYGISFSLDDFGMGNSNLNYIIEMPVEIVKFDRVLVNSYFNDPKARLVINKIIEMIKSLKLELVLEGIEAKDKLDEALTLDIDYIQGYYFSKPITKDEFINFLKKNN